MNIFTLFHCAALALTLPLLAGCGSTKSAGPAAARAEVVDVQGAVETRVNKTETWVRGSARQQLNAGSAIRTGPNSTASLRVRPGGPLVLVKPNSRVEFVQLAVLPGGASETVLDVAEGQAVVNDDHVRLGSTIEVRSPRGTVRIPPRTR